MSVRRDTMASPVPIDDIPDSVDGMEEEAVREELASFLLDEGKEEEEEKFITITTATKKKGRMGADHVTTEEYEVRGCEP